MAILEHRTRSTFDTYHIVSESDVRTALGKLANGTATEKGQSTKTGRVVRLRNPAELTF